MTLDERREEAFRIISLELPWMTFDKKTALVKALEICFVLGASDSLSLSLPGNYVLCGTDENSSNTVISTFDTTEEG